MLRGWRVLRARCLLLLAAVSCAPSSSHGEDELAAQALVSANVVVGDAVVFSVVESRLSGDDATWTRREQIVRVSSDAEQTVHYETLRDGMSMGLAWGPAARVDGRTAFSFTANDLGKRCTADGRTGKVVEVQVPAGTFLACLSFNRAIENHGHYSTDTFVETWYGPVLNRVIKSRVNRDHGRGRSTMSETVLTAIEQGDGSAAPVDAGGP